jgi:hypothetical protein
MALEARVAGTTLATRENAVVDAWGGLLALVLGTWLIPSEWFR